MRASSASGAAVAGVTRQLGIAFAGSGTVVLSYTNNLGGQVDHVFASASIDGGASWQVSHFRLDGGGGQAAGPAIAPISGGGLSRGAIVTWIDNRAGSQINGDVFVRRVGN